MKYYRYGKFRFRDYCVSWIVIVVLMIYSISSSILGLSRFFTILPMIYAMVRLCAILVPQLERFILNNDSITVFRYKKAHTIQLPLKPTIIVSYVDICPPLAIRTAGGNQTHILKDKYAVSILQNTPLDIVLEKLHRNYVRKYTTSRIQMVFDECDFIYSFVCNQSLLDTLVNNRKCILVIPGSLSDKFHVDSNTVNIHIDPKG